MKFLVDAQLPRRFARWLFACGFDAIHTLEMPEANATPDERVIERAEREKRIVVTKDDDFVRSFIVSGKPSRLWLISTGNIRNDELEALIEKNVREVTEAFKYAHFVELSRDKLTIHT
uniref:Predicted nuclease, contains PIN domain, potential toxin-antitoxin system component n=1 Tax=Candidatus Kentrum sp. FM TaxID=2126340 RepID=A0A450TXY4_9GAMM|nr:MAG: Predicted nuclease, contains PIN domain, potential toxin-antitoxin system component [Candidatus Kentron sp. FM]VFJ74535.1 MAG: Predicted nuclease, contains PIN domain, potential toxin-antitoxin system component [Candidatus Kentron sp. FM]VFK21288.1 MAG: Predicted nuclease, contains PIN domain, potential toxin-antitoxin system component [Candidatus Kentron sp. FM]